MIFITSFHRFFLIISCVALMLLLIAGCSDAFLKNESHQPSELDIEPEQAEVFVGNSVDFNVKLTDKIGNSFKHIPGWVDTLYSYPEGAFTLDEANTILTPIKAGESELTVRVSGMSEGISVVARPRAGMIQSTQCVYCSNGRIEIVEGRGGAIRLFLKGDEKNISGNVSLVVYQNEQQIDEISYSSQSLVFTPTDDPDITALYLPIPGNLVEPGLSVLVKTASNITYPKDGVPVPITMKKVPEFHIRLIPIHVTGTGRTGNVNENNMNEYIEKLLDMYPVNNYVVDVHAPVTVNMPSNGSFYEHVLGVVRQVWINEGQPDYYYYGVMPDPEPQGGGFYTLGLGYVGSPVNNTSRQAIGIDNNLTVFSGTLVSAVNTLAHELGHNMGRPHAPCGDPDDTGNYPYQDGSIGVYGYEADTGELKSPDVYKDIMSYCYPKWVSDFTYSKIMNFRLQANQQADVQYSQDVLMVSGSINNNKITLAPAFRVEAPPVLPKKSGPYTLSGFDANGNTLFSISFAGAKIDHSDTRNFVFTIPVERVHIKKLTTLRLSGRSLAAMQKAAGPAAQYQRNVKKLPDISANRTGTNTVHLNWSSTRYKKVMIKNARTDEIIGFTNEGFSEIKAKARKLKLYFSDGVHTTTKTVLVP